MLIDKSTLEYLVLILLTFILSIFVDKSASKHPWFLLTASNLFSTNAEVYFLYASTSFFVRELNTSSLFFLDILESSFDLSLKLFVLLYFFKKKIQIEFVFFLHKNPPGYNIFTIIVT